MIRGLGAAYRDCDGRDEVKVVVVTGGGDAFCAGADMSGGGDTFKGDNRDFSSCPLPFQAWGLGIALQADLRIFAAEGKYGFLQNRRGVVADFAAEYLLPRLVGFERAFELLVRAPRLSGTEAGEWGLASRVVPAAEVLDTAMEIATDMAENCAPLVMGLHKRLLWRGLDRKLDEMIDMETRALHHSMAQADAVEGGMAWFERRAPTWTGSVKDDWPDWME
jgi:enoyl-CoA hydratase/carnithine racemase